VPLARGGDMEGPIREWLKDRIRIREHEGIECFFLHSEYRHEAESEQVSKEKP